MSALENLVDGPRVERRLTYAELARRIELTPQNLSKVLSGKARLTTPVALRLAAELGLDARALLAAAPAKLQLGVRP